VRTLHRASGGRGGPAPSPTVRAGGPRRGAPCTFGVEHRPHLPARCNVGVRTIFDGARRCATDARTLRSLAPSCTFVSMDAFVEPIKQYPGQQQVERAVIVDVSGKHFTFLTAADKKKSYKATAVEYRERYAFDRHNTAGPPASAFDGPSLGLRSDACSCGERLGSHVGPSGSHVLYITGQGGDGALRRDLQADPRAGVLLAAPSLPQP